MARAWLGALVGGILALSGGCGVALAQPRQDFDGWLAGVRSEALKRGISQATVDATLADIKPIERVIELDRRQPEFTMTFEQYMAHVVSAERVDNGRRHLVHQKKVLKAVAGRYGVPAPVVVAMWGIESDYGRSAGSFAVLPALATLAYDGRRSRYFRGELIDALKMVDEGVPSARMRGSWAGAMGQCQFMPSTYVKYARRWAGAGKPDIWTTPPDVFASAANYLAKIGWNPRQRWGRAVQLPKHGMAPVLFGLETTRSLGEWRKLGLRQADGKRLPGPAHMQASLVRAETGKEGDAGHGPPYLVYDNFRVLMKWNRSVFFALAAGTLADRLSNQ